MATFYNFDKLWQIPPAAARLGANLPASKQAFETFRTDLEPMLSEFICAHPRCPADPDIPAISERTAGMAKLFAIKYLLVCANLAATIVQQSPGHLI
jgi:hypothetical protein